MTNNYNPLIQFEESKNIFEINQNIRIDKQQLQQQFPSNNTLYRFNSIDNRISMCEQQINNFPGSKFTQYILYDQKVLKHDRDISTKLEKNKKITNEMATKLQCFQTSIQNDNLQYSQSSILNIVDQQFGIKNLLIMIENHIVKEKIQFMQHSKLLSDKQALSVVKNDQTYQQIIKTLLQKHNSADQRDFSFQKLKWNELKNDLMLSSLRLNSNFTLSDIMENEEMKQESDRQSHQDNDWKLFPFAQDQTIYSQELQKLQLNWNQLEMLFQILEEEAFVYNSDGQQSSLFQQESDQSQQDNNSNLYIISSPTGTGKTLTFLLASLLWFQLKLPQEIKLRKKYLKTINSLVFANSSQVAFQIFEQYQKFTNLKVSFMDVYFKDKQFNLNIISHFQGETTKILSIDDSYECIYENIVIGGITQRVCKYLVKGENFIDIQHIRKSGLLGQIFVTSLHFYQFMEKYGIIDFSQKINNIIYDEVDVYYNFQKLDEFHRYFSKKYMNLYADNIIFSSATISPNLIKINDINLSNDNILMTEKKIQNELVNKDNIFRIITQQTTYAVVNIASAEQIFKNIWQQGSLYCYFNLHKQLYDYVSFKNNKTSIHFQNKTNQVDNIYDGIGLFNWILQRYNVVYLTNKKMRYKPFLQQCRQKCLKQKYIVNKFTSYQPSIGCEIHEVQLLQIESLLFRFVQEIIQQKNKTLFLTFQDPLIIYYLEKLQIKPLFEESKSKQTLLEDLNQKMIISDDKIVNLNIPFYQQLEQTIQDDEFKTMDSDLLYFYADFTKVSRGIDISKLQQVIILLPSCLSFERLGFKFSEFKQSLGRVGRNGNHGNAKILFYGIPDQQYMGNFQNEKEIDELTLQFLQMCVKKRIVSDQYNQIFQELMDTFKQNTNLLQNYIELGSIDVDDQTNKQLNDIISSLQD